MVATRINNSVAIVAYDRMATFEFAVPTEIFGLDRPEIGELYTMAVAAGEPGTLTAAFGLTVHPTGGLETIRNAGTVIVPGWRDRDEVPGDELLEALVTAHDRGARLLSICSGAYVLAATGLLDGRSATTHWRYAEHLRHMYPRIAVDSSSLFVDNGSVITSAGSAAGIDTCLHVVRHDWGAGVANEVARRLVVSPQRDGGQAQHISPADPPATGFQIASVLDAIERDLRHAHTLTSMARQANMSVRSFQRRFIAETGTNPSEWLVERRVHRARQLLEQTDLSVEQIAYEVGYRGAVSLRQQFRQRLSTSPTAYRRRYRSDDRGSVGGGR